MRLFKLAGVALAALAFAGPAFALQISYFNNDSYVDSAEEGANMRADLISMGHTVVDFTGITAGDFLAATTSADILVFPEMENADLSPDLDGAALGVISSYVSGGGHLVQANMFSGNSGLPNSLFGYSLLQSGSLDFTALDAAAAAGTPFAGGPASLSGPSAVEGVLSSSLPVGALNLYHGDFLGEDYSSVFRSYYGAGCYTYLGFDWYETPIPGDWFDVASRALEPCTTAVPEPSSVALLGAGLLGLAGLVRRRARG